MRCEMARLRGELSLVLIGAGLLTAGSFLLPQRDPVEVAAQKAEQGDIVVYPPTTGGTRPYATTLNSSTIHGNARRN